MTTDLVVIFSFQMEWVMVVPASPQIGQYEGGQRRAGGVDCCGGRTTGTVVYAVRPLNSRTVPVGRVYKHNNQILFGTQARQDGWKESKELAVVVVDRFRTRVRISQKI